MLVAIRDGCLWLTVSGGSSGIGLATARILQARGARVHVLDLHPIDESFDCHFSPWPTAAAAAASGRSATTGGDTAARGTITYRRCDVADWASLREAFTDIGHIDMAVANAGVSQDGDLFADVLDDGGQLAEPRYGVIDVNLRAVLNFVKLSVSAFRRQQKPGGAVVLVSSATAYAPELSLPVYSAVKLSVSLFSFFLFTPSFAVAESAERRWSASCARYARQYSTSAAPPSTA